MPFFTEITAKTENTVFTEITGVTSKALATNSKTRDIITKIGLLLKDLDTKIKGRNSKKRNKGMGKV